MPTGRLFFHLAQGATFSVDNWGLAHPSPLSQMGLPHPYRACLGAIGWDLSRLNPRRLLFTSTSGRDFASQLYPPPSP